MKHIKRLLLFFTLLFFVHTIHAQEPFPFWNDIQKFKTADSTHFPQSGQILFIGSSSFTKWVDVQDYFPGYKILNRGFGGSTLTDVIRFRYDVIYPYQPKQIILYCGENDFAYSDTVTAPLVVSRFKILYRFIRDKYPNIPFAYVSIKPSPSRKHLMPKIDEANKIIKKFLQSEKQADFIDVYHSMLQKDGTPIPDIFIEDNLHMNARGYTIWQKIIKPYLKK